MPSPETTAAPAEIEGPLEHAARSAAEAAYLARLDDQHREAWERASGARPERTSKRLLVALSHTIEKAVMSGPIAEPTVVVALFQKLAFFDREREVYERMAAAGVEVVIGFLEGEEHEAPEGVDVVLLAHDEPLADEWTVVAVGPEAGAFLVATDQHTVDPSERAYEASRQFNGRWGYSRAQAANELARLRLALGDRIAAEPRGIVDRLLGRTMASGGQPAASSGTQGEVWATTSLHHMIVAMRTAQAGTRELREQLADSQAASAARTSATVDPVSGLPDRDFLERWYTPDGGTTLAVGLALFDVPELGNPAVADDRRVAYHAAHQVAAALTQPLGPVDAAVRLSRREFLLVVPGASPRHLATLCDAVAEHLELASGGYPGVSLRATISAIVTTTRPLPLGDLQQAVGVLADGDAGPVDAGRTPHGERIVVASTRLHDPSGPTGRVEDGLGDGAHASVTPLERRDTDRRSSTGRRAARGGDTAADVEIDPADPLALTVPHRTAGPSGDDGTDVPRPRRREPADGAANGQHQTVYTDLSARPPHHGGGGL